MKPSSCTRQTGIVQSFCRYLLVGGSSFVIDFLIFFALVRCLAVPPVKAQVISRTTGAAFGFIGHKYFSFAMPADLPGRTLATQTAGYITIAVAGIVISPLILDGILRWGTSNLAMAKIGTEVVMVLLNFIAMRIVFAPNK